MMRKATPCLAPLALVLALGCDGAIGSPEDDADGLAGGAGGASPAGSSSASAGNGASTTDAASGSGSGSTSGAGGESAGAGGAGGGYVRQHLLFEADFEGNDPFGDFFNGQHCCDHSVTQSAERARTGSHSFRAEVRVGDPAVSSGYRAEILPQGISDTGDKWYGFAIYFETPTHGTEWNGTNGHFLQWHPDNSSGSASLGLWSYGDGWLVGLNPEGDSSADMADLEMPIVAGTWHDVVMHVDWDGGVVQVWIDGNLKLDATGVDYASGPGQYMKLGINRWGGGPNGAPNDDDWVIFYDDLRIGDEQATYADVAP